MSAASLPRPRVVGLRRRWLLGIAAAGLLATLAVAGWSFAWPAPAAPHEIALGQLEDFEPGGVTSYVVTSGGARELSLAGDYSPRPRDYPIEGQSVVHLVRLEDGQVLAFSGEDAAFGWTIVWYPLARDYWRGDQVSTPGRFAEPHGGAHWDIEGRLIFGPAPGDLRPIDALVLADGTVVVDVTSVLEAG